MSKQLRGDFAGNPNPLHPAFVHFPVVLVPLAAGVRLSSSLGFLPNGSGSWPNEMANLVLLLALISMVPASLTGATEYFNIVPKKQKAKKKARVHALLNTIVFSISLYLFVSISKRPGRVPTKLEVGLGMVSVVVLLISGHLGSELVYQHGIGVKRQGRALHESM